MCKYEAVHGSTTYATKTKLYIPVITEPDSNVT